MRCSIISTTSCCFGALLIVAVCFVGFNAADDSDTDGNKLWNDTAVDILKRYLLTNYDKYSRPVANNKSAIANISLSVHHADVDELRGVLSIHGWLRMKWHDDTFKWNPNDYGQIKWIHMTSSEVWHPHITVFNSATGQDVEQLGDTNMLVYNNGDVLWVPPYQIDVFCHLDLRRWPFDIQQCSLKVGTWSTSEVFAVDQEKANEIEEVTQSHEWKIKSVKSSNDADQFYHFINFELTLERRTSMYKAIISAPAACIVLLSLATFWLPPQAGEKILLNGIVIVIISAFLMYFAQLLPILAENTPLVLLFYSSSLVLVSVSMMIAVLVVYTSSTAHSRRMPQFWRNCLNGCFGSVLCLNHFSQDVPTPGEPAEKELQDASSDSHQIIDFEVPSKRSIQYDWILLATAIDRVCFVVYCLVFIGLAVAYSV